MEQQLPEAHSQERSRPYPSAVERIVTAMLKKLSEVSMPVTEAVLRQEVPGRKQYQSAALRLLVTDKKVLRIGSGAKGDPFLYSVAATKRRVVVEEIIL